MHNNKLISVFAFILFALMFASPVYAAPSEIKGDPELVWQSPLGEGNIENNAYNRCRLIKKLKPGKGSAIEGAKNSYEILSEYAANLYAQSIKLASHIEEEKENTDSSEPDLTNEKALLDNEVTERLGDIASRINIINSFEAATMLLKSLNEIDRLPAEMYDEFRVLKNGAYEYSDDCEDLKK